MIKGISQHNSRRKRYECDFSASDRLMTRIFRNDHESKMEASLTTYNMIEPIVNGIFFKNGVHEIQCNLQVLSSDETKAKI